MTAASPPTAPAPYLLVASAPGDIRAQTLVQALRATGGLVFYAQTPEQVAASITGAFACVVMMSPTTWNSPVNQAVVQAAPQRLVPVILEPMELPPGPWTTPTVEARSTPAIAVQAITLAITNYSRSRPVAVASSSVSPSSPSPPNAPPEVEAPDAPQTEERFSAEFEASFPGGDEWPSDRYSAVLESEVAEQPSEAYQAAEYSAPRRTIGEPRRGARRMLLAGVAAVLLVVVALVLIVPGQLSQAARSGNKNTADYTAAIPGPACDQQGALWQLSSDSAFTAACQSDGLLVTQVGHVDAASEVFYRGLSDDFPETYHAQIHAVITNGDAYASVGLEVHRQLTAGGDLLLVSADGAWSVVRTGAGNVPATRLALGFLPQGTKTLDLAVDVSGPVMAFSLNGKALTTVVDGTYPATHAIALVLSAGVATAPVAAHFSQFRYAPQTASPIDQASAQATATAHAAAAQAPYAAMVPGPGCDTGRALWEPTALYLDKTTNLTCTPAGLAINQAPTAVTVGQALFLGMGLAFPTNYTVAARVTLADLNGGCAGFLARTDAAQGGYSFAICQNGSWSIDRLDDAGAHTVLVSGQVANKPAITFEADLKGAQLSLLIDGVAMPVAHDATYTATDAIGLFAQTPQGVMGTATFKDFLFTPLL